MGYNEISCNTTVHVQWENDALDIQYPFNHDENLTHDFLGIMSFKTSCFPKWRYEAKVFESDSPILNILGLKIIITRWWLEEFTRVSYVYSSRVIVAQGIWGWLWDCILTYVVKMLIWSLMKHVQKLKVLPILW